MDEFINETSWNDTDVFNNGTERLLVPPQYPGVLLVQSLSPLLIPMFGAIVLVGVVGNVLLTYVILRNKSMRSVTNVFICNLAVSDIATCVMCIPFTLAYSLEHSWYFGEVMCYLVFSLQPTSVYLSIMTLTAIAIDRYYVIMYPFKPRMSMRTCATIIGLIWVVAVGLSLPVGINTHYLDFTEIGLDFYVCKEKWDEKKQQMIYTNTMWVVQYWLPLLMISAAYAKIGHKLRNRVMPGSMTERQQEEQNRRKRRTNRLMMSVVVAFAICWFPINIFNVINDVNIDLIHEKYYNLIQLLCLWFAMLSSCVNPFLYAWKHDSFRKHLRKTFLKTYRYLRNQDQNQVHPLEPCGPDTVASQGPS
ncbi:PREDICTED: prolactin-releasing peptide receptor-like [Branchiostoma belcheri]|uniref:Prolactin-releasing peptide receptor-like n=1 Tax=Branchiostoma belcheri TaxID=7741 RepID=A0A6P5A9P7_BRABE|nr:PREDICTED: prolactin-releasing peptide receptor-like [Branchiostoma belcheri]KAI8499506.1 hypothetical protein Bbelb_225570 [Branchiostoma belcheri]